MCLSIRREETRTFLKLIWTVMSEIRPPSNLVTFVD